MLLWKKIYINTKYKVLQRQKSGCVDVEEIVEMDDKELYVPDDVLEEARAARYQMLPKESKLRYQKELQKFTSE
jgi:hypothetical protein